MQQSLGHYKFGARDYDGRGHFTQPDPLTGGMTDPRTMTNYNYAAGDPINQADTSGLAYAETGVEACAIVCLSGAIGGDDQDKGAPDFTVGASIGPDIGITGFAGGGTGQKEGLSGEAKCSAAAGPVGGYAKVSGEGNGKLGGVGGGIQTGGRLGCSAGLNYTF